MLATHRDAEERYTKIRQAVLDEVNKDLIGSSKHMGLRCRLIDQIALLKTQQWGNSARRQVDWQWVEGYSLFKFRYPKRFEMALWHGTSLVSLSLGRPTYNGSKLRLDFIEGNPEKPGGLKHLNTHSLRWLAMLMSLVQTNCE